jgi:perosamine synthetase
MQARLISQLPQNVMSDGGGEALIPISQPKLSQRELEYVTDAITSGWVSSLGHYVDKFEESFASFCGSRYAVSVGNGTVGLHLAMKVLGIGAGDEVIVPDLTFVATGNTVMTAGATPIMVDVRRNTWCIDVDKIAAAITPRTRPSRRYASDHGPGKKA